MAKPAWDDTAKIVQQEAADSTKAVIKLIQQRLEKIPEIKEKINTLVKQHTPDGKRLKKAELKAILDKIPAYEGATESLYRFKQNINDEVNTLNRALGEMLTAEGKELQFITDKKKDGGLFKDLFSIDVRSSDLAKRLAAYESKLSGYTDAIKSGVARFTVGHHQHLATLRELALETKKRSDPKWWSEYTRKLTELGYEIGDKGIIRISRQAHKDLQKYKTGPLKGQYNLDGFLKQFGVTQDTPGWKKLYEKTREIMAHAGGTGGYKIPAQFANLSVDDAIDASEDILAVEKAYGKQGQLLTNALSSWSEKIKAKGGVVTEADLDELTRKAERIRITGIGEGNRSLQQFSELARVREKDYLAEANELAKKNLLPSVAEAAEQQKYIDKAGPLKIIQKAKDALENTRALQIAGDINKSVSKVPGLRSVVPGAALTLNALNIKSKADEYKKDPTISRRIQQGAAIVEGALEGIEIGTAGVASPVTTPLQIGLGILDASIDYAREGRQPGQAPFSMIGEIPGTKSYDKYVTHGISLKDIQIKKKEENPLTIANN